MSAAGFHACAASAVRGAAGASTDIDLVHDLDPQEIRA
ncbi:hypothetical protein FM106_19495 [Brachybacterium faecium]|nr:hypothetical protein FM106_19495 [Brachybacterium faecium]